jgi:osmoprotectant transport system substrate-binding protein
MGKGNRGLRRVVGAAVIVAAIGACSETPGERPVASALDDDAITVASFDFDESVLLAEIYGRALEGAGYQVEQATAIGPRELVQPSLQRGLVELVPEYLGTAVEFLNLNAGEATADADATKALLDDALRDRSVVALDPAPAQDANGIAVAAEMAAEHDLRTIEDLVPIAGDLRLGGPAECPERPLCLPGLERVYGLEFAEFIPLDASGPVTASALATGQVDVAVLFTTSGYLATGQFMLLEDNRGLQPAENVVPVLREEVLRGAGEEVRILLDEVSSALTTDELAELNRRVTLRGGRPGKVADEWLGANVR